MHRNKTYFQTISVHILNMGYYLAYCIYDKTADEIRRNIIDRKVYYEK